MGAGADALILDRERRVLLVRRADDGRWAMPGGWVDAGETAAQAAMRETLEETGLVVEALALVHVAARTGSVHLTFGCRVAGGRLRASAEARDVRYWDAHAVPAWHADHRERMQAALERPRPG